MANRVLLDDQPESAAAPGDQPLGAAQPRHAVAPTRDTQLGQRPPERDGPVALRVWAWSCCICSTNVRFAWARTLSGRVAGVVAAATDAEDGAAADLSVARALRVDELVSHGDSRAKNAAAFFKMSRSPQAGILPP